MTCCHGLMALGYLIITGLFSNHALTISGNNLFAAQSPPPITLPALAVANPTSECLKNDR